MELNIKKSEAQFAANIFFPARNYLFLYDKKKLKYFNTTIL